MPTGFPTSVASSARTVRRAALARAAGLVAVVLALVLSGCSSSDDLGGTVVEDGLGCTISEVDRPTEAPEVPAEVEVGEEVSTEDLVTAPEEACLPEGTGYLTLDLVGSTVGGDEPFVDTYGTDRPVTAQVGVGQLLPGLETGLVGMGVGGQRQIVIPAAQAYGPDGNEAQGIGPDEDLVFVVDLVAVSDSPRYCNAATDIPEGSREGKPLLVDMPVEAPTDGVEVTVLSEGDGPEAASDSYVTVDYLGVSCGSGRQFDSSWDREDPITVALVDATPTDTAFSVIPGWTEGLEGQVQGSIVQIDIPFELAYGAQGRPPDIGPSDPLTFVVEILEVADEAPPSPDPVVTDTTVPAGDETTTTAAGE